MKRTVLQKINKQLSQAKNLKENWSLMEKITPPNYLSFKINLHHSITLNIWELIQRLLWNLWLYIDYLHTGIVERVTIDNKSLCHYLHHRAVVGSKHEITKLQIVFNKPAIYQGFPSLNNLLDPGPYLLPCLCDIIVCF